MIKYHKNLMLGGSFYMLTNILLCNILSPLCNGGIGQHIMFYHLSVLPQLYKETVT